MTPEIVQVIADAALSPEACRIVLYVASLGPGAHEVKHTKFSALLNHPGEKAIQSALRLAVEEYLTRTPGGRGHADRYEFRYAPAADLKDRYAAGADLNEFRYAPGADLKRATTTSTDTSTTTTSERGREPEAPAPETDLARLRSYLGEHAYAVGMMVKSAAHPSTWAASIYGKYGPNGTLLHAFNGIPPDRQPAFLATVIIDYAGKRVRYENRHFDGFIRSATATERRKDNGTTGLPRSGRAGEEAGGKAPAGRSKFRVEDGDSPSSAA